MTGITFPPRNGKGANAMEKTTTVQIVMPQHCNGYAKPRLFGGQIMAWIDVVGAVANFAAVPARRPNVRNQLYAQRLIRRRVE